MSTPRPLPGSGATTAILRWARDLPAGPVLAVVVTAIAATARADDATGVHLSLVLVYVLLVAFAAMVFPLRSAMLTALLAGVTSLSIALEAPEIPDDVAVLNAALRTVFLVGVAYLVAMNRATLDQLDEQSTTDPMTGCLNRRGFYAFLGVVVAASRRSGAPTTVAYFDLDGLKQVNDQDGHDAGDRLILAFADAVRSAIRAMDAFGRMGGDEFCLVLPETDVAGAEAALSRIRLTLGGHQPPLSASCGVVVWTGPPTDLDAVVQPADDLMYAAKVAQRGSYRVEARSGADAG